MKKMITLALLALMVACAPKPLPCELFGVSLGMSRDEVTEILTNSFGAGKYIEECDEVLYEEIFYEGLSYSFAQFIFENNKLSYVDAMCTDEVVRFRAEHEVDEINKIWDMVQKVDYNLSKNHRVYHNPLSVGISHGSVVSIAAKDLHNTDDIITVAIHENKASVGYNHMDAVRLHISLIKLEKSL